MDNQFDLMIKTNAYIEKSHIKAKYIAIEVLGISEAQFSRFRKGERNLYESQAYALRDYLLAHENKVLIH